ncbi:MAG: 4-hydroxythreonine-4-phosphate dehydrogenase PdxA [Muribaculaceae bacterium]|nr:4-hydroxythreonine-4-phosphate dehydrogenase PdxA [Muribaculaceae bacterium]
MERLIKVGITQGDFNGIGPEVTLKALSDDTILELFTPVVFADWRIVEYTRKTLGLELPECRKIQTAGEAATGHINVVDLRLGDTTVEAGKPTQASGAGAVASLEAAMKALGEGEIDVLVTAPISKEAVQCDAFRYPGHTEYLEAHAGEGAKAQMILFDDNIRVALVTTHLPVTEVPGAITQERVSAAVREFSATLRQDFGMTRPRIAVLSLNPHCGDGGLLGHEETDTIIPAIETCATEGLLAFGPFAADGFFGSGAYKNFDGVLAMYHDQGLAPFKALARDNGVNFTAGLPFVRTSPDHGTAFDIAWKNEADPASMREAIYKAIDIFRCRTRHKEASADPLRHQQHERPQKPERTRKPEAREQKPTDNE